MRSHLRWTAACFVFLLTMGGCEEEEEEEEAPAPAEHREHPLGTERPGPGLSQALYDMVGEDARDYEALGEAQGETLEAGAFRDVQTVLGGARCYRIFVAGDGDLQGLRAVVFDQHQVQIAQGMAETGQSRLRLGVQPPICVSNTGLHRIRLESERGDGNVMIQVMRSRLW